MTEEFATNLEAFNANGIHVGSAHLSPDGRWLVNATNVNNREVATMENATDLLFSLGATTVRTSRGKK